MNEIDAVPSAVRMPDATGVMANESDAEPTFSLTPDAAGVIVNEIVPAEPFNSFRPDTAVAIANESADTEPFNSFAPDAAGVIVNEIVAAPSHVVAAAATWTTTVMPVHPEFTAACVNAPGSSVETFVSPRVAEQIMVFEATEPAVPEFAVCRFE